jgi:hypothetical protein
MLRIDQTLQLVKTGKVFRVIEANPDGTRAIVECLGNRGRLLAVEAEGKRYARQVRDNGGCGGLLETLDAYGPRYRLLPDPDTSVR